MKHFNFPTHQELKEMIKTTIAENSQAVGYPDIVVEVATDINLVFNPESNFGREFQLQFGYGNEDIIIASVWSESFSRADYEKIVVSLTEQYKKFVNKLTK